MDRIVMAPSGVPEARMKILRDAFAKLNADKTYQNLMKRIGENTEYMDGPEYDKTRPVNQEAYRETGQKDFGPINRPCLSLRQTGILSCVRMPVFRLVSITFRLRLEQ